MFAWIRYRYKLARLKISHREQAKPLLEEWETARKGNKPVEERDKVWSSLEDKVDRYRDELATLQTHYLADLASKWLIPLPEMSDAATLGNPDPSSKWRRSKTYAGLILTDDAIRELRLALRADHRERLEIVRSWVGTIVPGFTGLIGVIIGLLAVILGRR
jgi:hypothetical protein